MVLLMISILQLSYQIILKKVIYMVRTFNSVKIETTQGSIFMQILSLLILIFLANLSFFFRITELISTKLGIKHS